MTCSEFEGLLDLLEKGQSLPDEALAHAASCSNCALALRLERVIFAAPKWTKKERMTVERRAAVLARVRTGNFISAGMAETLYESLLNAVVALALLGAAAIFAPPYLKDILPPAVYDLFGTFSAPVLAAMKPVTTPLLATPIGTVLLVIACFTFCFAAAFSARIMAQQAR